MGSVYGRLKIGKNFIKTIYELEVGETGYTIPGALEFDHNLDPYLNLNEVFESKEDRSSYLEMIVTRTGKNDEDFEVNIEDVKDYSWKKTNNPFTYDIRQIEDEDENTMIVKLKYEPNVDYEKRKEINRKFRIKAMERKINEAVENEDFELAEKIRKDKEKLE